MSRIDELIAELCPDGVEFKALGDVVVMKAGQHISASAIADEKTAGLPYPVYGGNGQRGWVAGASHSGSFLLIGRQGALCGNVKRVSGDFFATEHAVVTEPTELMDVDFAFHLLTAMDLNQYKSSGAQPGLAVSNLAEVRIRVPPLEVQREIVRILDQFTALEAELEAELEARRSQYHHYRHELLSFGPETSWTTLTDVAEYTNGKAHEKLADPDGDIPMVTARFISRNGEANRFVRLQDVLTPANVGDTAIVLSDLPNGRALARTFYIDRDDAYAINQRIARLRVRDLDKVEPRFLFHVMDRSPGLLKYDNGVDQTHLSKSQVTNLSFPLPSLVEQNRIVEILDRFDALVNDLSVGLPAELAARRKQYEYYRDRLLSFKERAA